MKNDEIRKVQVLFDVSFEGYSNEAKNVYQKTIEAFYMEMKWLFQELVMI